MKAHPDLYGVIVQAFSILTAKQTLNPIIRVRYPGATERLTRTSRPQRPRFTLGRSRFIVIEVGKPRGNPSTELSSGYHTNLGWAKP